MSGEKQLEIRELVRLARQNAGLNTADFGALLGVSGRTVEGWEQGRRTPSGPALILIKNKLNK